jgi:NAD+ synthase/NAD+ synthase (glutamine-hydrolysing)
MKIALAQYNPVVGDIANNSDRMAELIDAAADAGADLVVFSELSIVGYPPRDLLRKDSFVADNLAALDKLAARSQKIAALVGFVRPTPGDAGRPLQNAAALLAGGEVRHIHVKALLPTYDVFDETRYFEPDGDGRCIHLGRERFGLTICEDLWDAAALGRELYGADPIGRLAADKPCFIINMAASPYQAGKVALREELFARQARRAGCPIVYVNQLGGNDDLVFDGTSCVVDAEGKIIGRAKSFESDLLVVDLEAGAGRVEPLAEPIDRLAGAIELGLRDYVTKCGFERVVLGLSGGIDSALVAALAAEALGPRNVLGLAMPSRYSSDHSLADARELAANLGIEYQEVPIEPMHKAYEQALDSRLAGGNTDAASENIQARIRGNIVMAYSNAFGHLPLATGNKSELSCGYCTLYGDMAGGLAPIGDVLKTEVYALSRRINENAGRSIIPQSTITKPPSAELKPGQVDQDKLPPYDLLDAILQRYIEEERTAGDIVSEGFDPAVVSRVIQMVDRAEYKRKQAAPVLKVTARAFGTGRRMPIAQRYVPAARPWQE